MALNRVTGAPNAHRGHDGAVGVADGGGDRGDPDLALVDRLGPAPGAHRGQLGAQGVGVGERVRRVPGVAAVARKRSRTGSGAKASSTLPELVQCTGKRGAPS